MTPETKELFSDLKFFNKLLSKLTTKSITEKPTLESLIKLLKKSKKVNINNFDETKFLFESESEGDDFTSNCENFNFHFELKNKNENHYNPVSIRIEYNEEKEKYKVTTVEYATHEKQLWIFVESDYMNNTISNENYIRFYNEKEKASIYLNIKDHDFKFYDSDESNELFKKYFSDIKTQKDAVSIMKRILHVNPASLEQQELEILNNDFTLENCIFSSKLNKAETAFCMKNDKKLKNKSTNKK